MPVLRSRAELSFIIRGIVWYAVLVSYFPGSRGHSEPLPLRVVAGSSSGLSSTMRHSSAWRTSSTASSSLDSSVDSEVAEMTSHVHPDPAPSLAMGAPGSSQLVSSGGYARTSSSRRDERYCRLVQLLVVQPFSLRSKNGRSRTPMVSLRPNGEGNGRTSRSVPPKGAAHHPRVL